MDSKNTININQVIDTCNSVIPGDGTTTIRATRGKDGEVYTITIPMAELFKAAGLSKRQLLIAHGALAEEKVKMDMAFQNK